jgi:DNA-binding CsgD family transcriptional regulator
VRFAGADATAKLLRQDPVSALVQRFMAEHPLEEDEESLLFRWFLDREDYQAPSARVLAITGRQSQLVLGTRRLAYSFCVFRTPGDWVSLWKDIDLPWQLVGRFTLGKHDYSLLAFLWKSRSLRDVLVQAWQTPSSDESSKGLQPSFDELRIKVAERVASLTHKLKLTPREREILEHLCLGYSPEDIAQKLSIRPRTVKFHQENLLRKTGASSRAELFKKLL